MLAVLGRDMDAELANAGGPELPAAVTLPSLRAGNVTHALATIFTEIGGSDNRIGYAAHESSGAKRVGLAQLRVYEAWVLAGKAKFLKGPATHPPGASPPLTIGILVECADPIEGPAELAWWQERGVVAVGLAWGKGSRYSAGNNPESVATSGTPGLTDLGRAMVKEMDRLGVVPDASHLSDAAMDEVFTLTDRPVIASHSNSRALIGDPANQRHLTDRAIAEIARRGGVIGLNLYAPFLRSGLAANQRPGISDCVRHIDHICDIAGGRGYIGLGSDMDGGFSAARLPAGIDGPADLGKLAEALADEGWNSRDIQGFASENWKRFWR